MATRIWVREGGDDLSQVAKQVQRANREAHLNTENNNELSERVTASATAATTPVNTGGNPNTRIQLDPAANRRGVFPMHAWLYVDIDYEETRGITEPWTLYSPSGNDSISWTFGEGSEYLVHKFDYWDRSIQVLLPVGNDSFVFAYHRRVRSESQTVGDLITLQYICALVTPYGVKEIQMPGKLLSQLSNINGEIPYDTFFAPVNWLDSPGHSRLTSFGLDYSFYSFNSSTPPIYWWLENYNEDQDYDLAPEQLLAQYSDAQYGKAKTGKWIRPYVDTGSNGYNVRWFQQPTYDAAIEDSRELKNYGKYGVPFPGGQDHLDEPYLVTCWDAGIGSTCRQLALGLGFSQSDLTL